LEGEALKQVGRPDPFMSASRIHAEVKEVDMIAQTLTVRSVAVEGLDLTVRRDARGVIDVVEMFTPKPTRGASAVGTTPPAAPPSPSAGPPRASTTPEATAPAQVEPRRLFPVIRGLAAGFKDIRIERITLAPSAAAFVDDGVKPPTRLALTQPPARGGAFTRAVRGPAAGGRA